MTEFNYKQIQKIDMSATKKLLNYISEEIQDETILDTLEFFYPDFGEQKHSIAFNVWISIDFIGKDGKTFIEKFLKEKSNKLTPQEKEVLYERNRSNISLFEILDTKGEFIEVADLFENKTYTIWEPDLVSNISVGDLALARVGNLLGHITFIGDISFLPSSIKSTFLEEVFIDFNRIRLSSTNLTMNKYLKKHSINLYRIYTNCIFKAMEMDEDILSILYDEIDEFESYLSLKTSKTMIKKYVANLIDFFEYYLADEDLTLYDLDQIDLNFFFTEAINDGFIMSQEDLNSYISTFKNYLRFLSIKSIDYKEAYKELLSISESRFDFIDKFKMIKSPFVIDRELSNTLSDFLNEDSISLVMDYDKFILYMLDRPLELTEKNKFIKRKNLMEINEILELGNYTDKSSPNQQDFPLIHMFYNFSIYLGLMSIDGNKLLVSNKGSNYLRLRDEDKYTLFFQYIWNNNFISHVSNIKNSSALENIKKNLIKSLSSLKENINYEISNILGFFTNYPGFFFEYHMYLQFLGIIKCNLYPHYEIKLTSLGKIILSFLEVRNNKKHECSIIHLESFKKSR